MQQNIDYLVAGHITVDWIEGQGRSLGGPALFTAITARNLGARVCLLTSTGEDLELDGLLDGVMVHRVPSPNSTAFAVRYGPDGERTQWIQRRAAMLRADAISDEWMGAAVVHVAPEWGEFDRSFVDAVGACRLFLTPQGFLRRWHDDGEIYPGPWEDADRLLPRAEAVVLSEVDVADPDIIEQWAAQTRVLVMTQSERGATVYMGAERYHAAAFRPACEVDPTGAGDVFAAAYFWRLAQGGDPRESADWANCVASFAVEGVGCHSIPQLDAVERRWAGNDRI